MANIAVYNNTLSGNNWNNTDCWVNELGSNINELPGSADDVYLNNSQVYVPADIGVSITCGNIYPGGTDSAKPYNNFADSTGNGTLIWQASQDFGADWIRGSKDNPLLSLAPAATMNVTCNVVYGPRAIEIGSGDVTLNSTGGIYGGNASDSSLYAVVLHSSGNTLIINTPVLQSQPELSEAANYSATVVRVNGAGHLIIGSPGNLVQITGGKNNTYGECAVAIDSAAVVEIFGNLTPPNNGYDSGSRNNSSNCVYVYSASTLTLHGTAIGSSGNNNCTAMFHNSAGGIIGALNLGNLSEHLTVTAGPLAPAIVDVDVTGTCNICGNIATTSIFPAIYMEFNSANGSVSCNTENCTANLTTPAIHIHSAASFCSTLNTSNLTSNMATLTAQNDTTPALNAAYNASNSIGAAILMTTANTTQFTNIVLNNTIIQDTPNVPAIFHAGLHRIFHNPVGNNNNATPMEYRADTPGGMMTWWTPGNYVLPTAGDVVRGANFGADGATSGNLTLPANNKVESGVSFGPNNNNTGTLDLGDLAPAGLVQDLVL